MFAKQFVTLVLCVLPVLAAPSPLVPVAKAGEPIAGRYIVTLKNNVARSVGVSSINKKISSQSKITHEWDIINGFAGDFTDADLEVLRADSNVKAIEEEGIAHPQAVSTQ